MRFECGCGAVRHSGTAIRPFPAIAWAYAERRGEGNRAARIPHFAGMPNIPFPLKAHVLVRFVEMRVKLAAAAGAVTTMLGWAVVSQWTW